MELHHSSGEGGTRNLKKKRAEPPEPSSVSMKSDRSIGEHPNFSSGGGEPSSVSMKSDRSIGKRPNFSSGGQPSCVSMKSDRSIGKRPNFSSGGEPSCVSMKSDRSIGKRPNFSSGGGEPSSVSMKSDRSIGKRPNFSSGAASPDLKLSSSETELQKHIMVGGTGTLQQDSHQPVEDVLQKVIKRHKTSMKNKYKSLFEGTSTVENRTLLNRIYTQLYIIEGESKCVNEEHEVRKMKETPWRNTEDTAINCSDIFKPLQDHKGLKYKERKENDEPKVADLRVVLTKGIAGIGKTVSVQKFILDWAEGKANQDVDFMFVLPFRELNFIKDDQYSLHGLLCVFHPELKELDPKIYNEHKAVFIFDGLDESRIPLNFKECEKVYDITMTSSVDVLMANLVKGELLPSALIWITCRPAAANQIPHKHINRVTEIQGFNDPQKEDYFRKRISDQDQAQKIISHIKTARSLHIMCHIPVFCWISSTVLQRIIKQRHTENPKTLTEMYIHFLLTQTHMTNKKYEKKDERDPKKLLESNRTKLLKLADLAFKQLMKGNVMFYEEDLKESGIDITEASTFSGVFTEIFREDCGLYQKKVYCFVHLSFQEFLAAVYVFHCHESEKKEELQCFEPEHRGWYEILFEQPIFKQIIAWFWKTSLDVLLERAVNKAVESLNGHLDLFLRFLLGISLESNQRLLKGLLTQTHTHSEKTTEHIKSLITREHKSLSTQRAINLFLCLSEIKDQSLSSELQEYLKSEKRSEVKLSPGQCSTLAYMLLTSEEVLEKLDLKKYNTSEEGYRRLIPAVTSCRIAVVSGCFLTEASCEAFSSALQSVNSSLKELDLSNNDLQDSGVKLLSVGLKSSHSKLETLSLAVCNLGEKSCNILRSVLQSVNSSLKKLDLSYNNLQDFRLEQLSAGLKSSHCKLETLSLAQCYLGQKSCKSLQSVLKSVNSSLKELDLSNNDLRDSGVELLSDGLKSSRCKLETLRLSGCMVTQRGCSSLASALKSNPSHLRELDLTYNHPGKSGLRLFNEMPDKMMQPQVEHGGNIRMKPGVKKYACKFTLNPKTASTRLSLSDENRKVECVKEYQPYQSDRYTYFGSVLSLERLTGRCYWEAEWSGKRGTVIAVSYSGIRRNGHSDDFATNKLSWSLEHLNNRYSVYHNKKKIYECFHQDQSGRVGVYLDWPAGILSFYSISSHTLNHIHTLQTTFTEPLYAGFGVHCGSWVHICEIE